VIDDWRDERKTLREFEVKRIEKKGSDEDVFCVVF